jgi:hypothetical protein
LGDGIEHVAIDAEDRVWVGWFDEGMFGNDGWRVPGQEWPPSSNGVACFATDGALLPLPVWPAEAGTIADCYALNCCATIKVRIPVNQNEKVVAGLVPRGGRSPTGGASPATTDDKALSRASIVM